MTVAPKTGSGKVVPFRKKAISATRAKTLTPEQFERVLAHVRAGLHAKRDVALVMLSFYCGLRAQEIAGLRWRRNVFDAEGEIGDVLHVTSDIGKRCVEREIPMNGDLRRALRALRSERPDDIFIIYPVGVARSTSKRERGLDKRQCEPNTLVQYLRRLYKLVGFKGCTSHSGRRTFITNLARRCGEAKSSLRDVQLLAGHKSLETTAAYIAISEQHHKLVNLVF